MQTRISSATPWGIEARRVELEVEAQAGPPGFRIAGLSEAARRESCFRLRCAIETSGYELPPCSLTLHLAPVDLLEQAAFLDLAMAVALLSAGGELSADALSDRLLYGELAFDGSVRPVRGALAMAEFAARDGIRELIVPAANASEAKALGGVTVIPVRSLRETVEHLLGRSRLAGAQATGVATEPVKHPLDLSEIRGREAPKRALEVAAAGGHHLLVVGSPGSGKTRLARRLPGILPPLASAERVAVTKIQSLVAEHPPSGLISQRPFRSPHPSVPTEGMLGGESIARPGEVSLAHGGVLFLDELPEFRRDVLEALQQPLQEGEVTVVRRRRRFSFPARFALVAAMAPCPCGLLGDPRHECRCTPRHVESYRSWLCRSLLECIDLHVEVPAVSLQELKGPRGESSAEVARRVLEAREVQRRRFRRSGSTLTHAAMSPEELERFCVLEPDARRFLDVAFKRLELSAGALSRIFMVARTVADLDGSGVIRAAHVAEAIQYRGLAPRR